MPTGRSTNSGAERGSQPCRIFAIADDLTGALEVGAKFARLGSTVLTRLDAELDKSVPALIIDTETRHLSGERAMERVVCLLERAGHRDPELIYKKIDSTLRGNIGPELRALAATHPDRAIVFAPAYPEMGRAVRNGRVYVDGSLLDATSFASDALNPVLSSYIPDAIGSCGLPVILHEDATAGVCPGAVHVFDAMTEDDVASITRFADDTVPTPIFCGAGSLAGHLSRALATEADAIPMCTTVRSCLVVNGSRNEKSIRQIRFAQDAGWPAASPEEILQNGMPAGWTVLNCTFDMGAKAKAVAARIGAAVREIVCRGRCDTVVVFGGDTAYGVIEALGQPMLSPIRELLPGVPSSKVGDIQMITKAGGFGPDDLLLRVRRQISEA